MLSPSFHRKMSKEEAELKLAEHGSYTCYLTRYDEASDQFYLSVMTMAEGCEPDKYHHFIINITKKGSPKEFPKPKLRPLRRYMLCYLYII